MRKVKDDDHELEDGIEIESGPIELNKVKHAAENSHREKKRRSGGPQDRFSSEIPCRPPVLHEILDVA
jgi:hypothetical protein